MGLKVKGDGGTGGYCNNVAITTCLSYSDVSCYDPLGIVYIYYIYIL